MKGRFAYLCLAAILLSGCQTQEAPVVEPHPLVVQKVAPVGEPSSKSPSKLALVVKKGPPITVGYPLPDKAFDQFKKTPSFGLEFDDLPPHFEYPYRARSWETARSGFGEILYDGELVAAMYQEQQVKQDRVDEIVAAHRAQMDGDRPDELITGKKVTYWFWKTNNQRLMICANQKNQKGIELTIAMGDNVVLDGLGISPELARADVAKMDAPSIKVIPTPAVATPPAN